MAYSAAVNFCERVLSCMCKNIFKNKRTKTQKRFCPLSVENPKEKEKNRKRVKILIYMAAVLSISAMLTFFTVTAANDVCGFLKEDKECTIELPENAGIEDIADILSKNGIIEYPDLFRLYGKIKYSENYTPEGGTYTVNKDSNYDALFSAFEPKLEVKIVRLTISDGMTVDDIIDMFTVEGIGTREGFEEVINNYHFEYDFVDAISMDNGRKYRLEGYLYPDTYDFYTGKDEEYYISKMLDRFDNIFTEEFKIRASELSLSVDEIVTIASIIEEETKDRAQFEYVSSVIFNRLNDSETYPCLECDATLIYAYKIVENRKIEKLTLEDFDLDSKYNTHKYEGLPPSAISNPGFEAICCALYPAQSNYKYFFTDSDGYAHFSVTYYEHKTKYEQYYNE